MTYSLEVVPDDDWHGTRRNFDKLDETLRQFQGMIGAAPFYVYRAAGLTITNGADVVFDFDTKRFDPTNAYDLTNNWWTAPATGIYRLGGGVLFNGSIGDQVRLILLLDDSDGNLLVNLDRRYTSGTTNDHGIYGSALVEATAGKRYQLRIRQDAPAGVAVQTGAQYCYFNGGEKSPG